ncbi:MAG: methyltransferase domain-containing protein [Puniceicoccales bacterium]|nr:methyltransferase domain-containing protein [Puniceicoccales bacterium]
MIKIFLRMHTWFLREFCRALLVELLRIVRSNVEKLRNGGRKLRILVLVGGGVGDVLMQGLAIKELFKRINCDHSIDVTSSYSDPFHYFPFIFYGWKFLNIKHKDRILIGMYDVVIKMDRVTSILYCDGKFVSKKSPWLHNFCTENEKFFAEHGQFFGVPSYSHAVVNQWSILHGRKRIQQADQCGLLGINDSSHTLLDINPGIFQFVEKVNLGGVPYVTIQRGINYREQATDSTKIWPISHYEKFVKMFHETFPLIKIVQLGYSNKFCKAIDGVDLNLVGETSLYDVASVLKCSLLHIDGDGGMVHMKRFLNGKSVVVFGPTSADLFGYSGNVNLMVNVCKNGCEWVTDTWYKKCLRGFDGAPCMESVTPEMVMEATKRVINSLKDYSYAVVDSNIGDGEIADYVIANDVGRNARIIDVFNKNGMAVARKLAENFLNLTVFRDNFKFDAFSDDKNAGLKLEYGCIYNISVDDNSCDIVIWQSGCDAVPSVEYAIGELFRVLKPGGSLIVSGVELSSPTPTLQRFGIFSKSIKKFGTTVLTKTEKS